MFYHELPPPPPEPPPEKPPPPDDPLLDGLDVIANWAEEIVLFIDVENSAVFTYAGLLEN